LHLGGFDNLVKARKHYAISLQHQCAAHNLRAVYGVLYACRALRAVRSSGGSASTTAVVGGDSSAIEAADRCVPCCFHVCAHPIFARCMTSLYVIVYSAF
jgi:hypothetical protein